MTGCYTRARSSFRIQHAKIALWAEQIVCQAGWSQLLRTASQDIILSKVALSKVSPSFLTGDIITCYVVKAILMILTLFSSKWLLGFIDWSGVDTIFKLFPLTEGREKFWNSNEPANFLLTRLCVMTADTPFTFNLQANITQSLFLTAKR